MNLATWCSRLLSNTLFVARVAGGWIAVATVRKLWPHRYDYGKTFPAYTQESSEGSDGGSCGSFGGGSLLNYLLEARTRFRIAVRIAEGSSGHSARGRPKGTISSLRGVNSGWADERTEPTRGVAPDPQRLTIFADREQFERTKPILPDSCFTGMTE